MESQACVNGCLKWFFTKVSAVVAFLFIFLFFVDSAYAESLLWRIEKKDEPVSYLYGTVHIGKVGSGLSENVYKYLDSADALMLEGDVLGIDTSVNDLQKLVLAMIDRTASLDKKLGSKYYNAVSNMVNEEQRSGLRAMKPWAVLIIVMYTTPEGYSLLYGKDILLAIAAEELFKKQYYLEGAIETAEYFTRLPERRAIEFIRTIVDDKAQIEQDALKLVQFHEDNNVKEMIKYIDSSLLELRQSDDKFWANWYDKILDARTANWVPRITKRLSTESIFIAVGAAHLYGDNGLIKKLSDEGYKLTPIKP